LPERKADEGEAKNESRRSEVLSWSLPIRGDTSSKNTKKTYEAAKGVVVNRSLQV